MGKSTGFLEYDRQVGKEIPVFERIKNFHEFHTCLSLEEQRLQGARCMDCGIPFCQSGAMIGGMASGCPLHNLVPEINDLVYHGNFEQAYVRLTAPTVFQSLPLGYVRPSVKQPVPAAFMENRWRQRKMRKQL